MGLIKIIDVESVRFAAPDLAQMRAFLLDFGMIDTADAGDGALRMRGTGDAPFIHETHKGEAGFLGLTLRAESLDDLQVLSDAEGVGIDDAPGPGGGKMVALTDPDGYRVEVIADKARAEPMPHGTRDPWNAIERRERPGRPKRLNSGPAHVVRLGHVVLGCSDTAGTWDWWQQRFGLIMSDEVRAPDGALAAAFVRCDRGLQPTDHHTLNFAAFPGVPPKFHHSAYEVADLDDLMAGGQFLAARGYHHDWGVGRHILGSQVFDYWKDPFGNRIEHWTDGDLFDATVPTNVTDIPTMMGHQWGPGAPVDFAA